MKVVVTDGGQDDVVMARCKVCRKFYYDPELAKLAGREVPEGVCGQCTDDS